jgi:hypothetical protein
MSDGPRSGGGHPDFAALQELIETGLAGALTEPGF